MRFDDYENCKKCPDLYKLRTQIVWGFGDEKCDLMFIAEGPGKEEDFQGIPFQGEAGHLLDELLTRAEIDREDLYITNSVLCRPTQPGATLNSYINRKPSALEVANCLPRLKQEVLAIDPILIVALGEVAATALRGKKVGIKKSRGTLMDVTLRTNNDVELTYGMLPVLHPSYLLRTKSQDEIAATVFDLQLAKDIVLRYKAALNNAYA